MTVEVLCVVGARPNFMKVAPILRVLDEAGIGRCLVHTGQHYDEALSGVFFRDLRMPAPDVFLGVGSGSHAEQTARVMLAFEPVLLRVAPRVVVVVGDVNSTVACALVAAKVGVPVAHVEAGLRSRDRTMPEELNRVVTDQLSDLCLTPSADADDNLRHEGVDERRIRRVGNVMVDALVAALPAARRSGILGRLGLSPGGYALATLHRPANVDDRDALAALLGTLREVGREVPVVFPVHPRTRARLSAFQLVPDGSEGDGPVRLIEPVGYVDCVALEAGARVVLTDSGGIQEETTYLGVPCLTLRANTERPVTVTEGTNRVVGRDQGAILAGVRDAGEAKGATARRPALWDGRTAERILAALREAFEVGAGAGRAGVSAGAL